MKCSAKCSYLVVLQAQPVPVHVEEVKGIHITVDKNRDFTETWKIFFLSISVVWDV